MFCPGGGDAILGPPMSSANDSAVNKFAVADWTWTPCMPGATIHPGSELRCDHGVSREKIPGTVVSL